MKPVTAVIVGIGVLLLAASKSNSSSASDAVRVVIPPHPLETEALDKKVTERHVADELSKKRGGKGKAPPFRLIYEEAPKDVDPTAAIEALSHRASDESAAKRTAQSLADSVRNSGGRYDQVRVAAWQAVAGIRVTGVYGAETVKKLRALGAKNVVGPMGPPGRTR